MPLDEIRLGLLKENPEMPSGYEICGYLWIIKGRSDYLQVVLWPNSNPIWSKTNDGWYNTKNYSISFDKLIQFSPFKDKNGRVLKEGE